MKVKVLVTTIVSVLLLAAVTAAGLNAVFTVTAVHAEFNIVSADGEAEAASLKERLDGFIGSSTTFLDLENVRGIIEENPCMKVEKLEKHYPSTLELSVSERKEAFSFLTEHGYATLAEDGFYLYHKDALSNRTGGENIFLDGFTLQTEQGKLAEGDKFNEVLVLYRVFSEELNEVRANVLAIAYHPGLVFDTFEIRMREGVRIEIVAPADRIEDKARAALSDAEDGYLSLEDKERLCGCITVVSSEDEIFVDYAYDRN